MHFTGQPGERQELHVRDEVELAAAPAVNSVAAAASATRLSATGLRQYWTVAKLRLDRWNRFLRGAGARRTPGDASPTSHGANTRAWFEEIIVGEVLTRVWAANVVAHHHGVSDGSGCEFDLPCSIVRRVVESHTQVRHQALQLLAGQEGQLPLGLSPDEAAGVDRLRRSIARWIDLLVAHVHENAQQASIAKLPTNVRTPTAAEAARRETGIDVCDLAIDPDRARDFADDLTHQRSAGLHGRAAALAIGSLRATLGDRLSAESPNADLNHALATSIVACFAPGLFESTGVYRSLWTQRLANHSADVEGLIGDLVAMEF